MTGGQKGMSGDAQKTKVNIVAASFSYTENIYDDCGGVTDGFKRLSFVGKTYC